MSQNKQMRSYRSLTTIARWLGLGLAAGALVSSEPATAAQELAYRPSEGVPVAWTEFARRVKGRLEEWIAQDDEPARHFRASLDAYSKTDRAAAIVARLWIAANGKIERVEFDGLDAKDAVELRAILVQKDMGVAPPVDMIQPLHLKLSTPSKN
jgi:hypothetical protein